MSPHVPLPSVMGLEILLVSPQQSDHESLGNILRHRSCGLHCFRTYGDAVSYLREHPVGVMISSASLPDGDWKNLLSEISSFVDAPNLIVTSRLADERLWAEVLNMGGYDLLVVPYDPDEVFRITAQAWLDWERRRNVRLQKAKPAPSGSFDLARRIAAARPRAKKPAAVAARGSGDREEYAHGHRARESSRRIS